LPPLFIGLAPTLSTEDIAVNNTKTIFSRCLLALACTMLPAMSASQNAPQSPSTSETVLRVTTRLVLVDAVVVDKAGKPITNLSEKDFTVLEDGKPQNIAAFSAHQPDAPKSQPPLLQPHVATNRPEAMQMEGTVAVLLLDGLNTPPQNQVHVRQQMLKFLAKHFDPSYKIAVLALTNKLVVLQDFTSDPMLLKAALDRYTAQTPAVARTGGETNMDSSQLTQPIINVPAQATGATGATASDPGLPGTAGGANSSFAEDIAYMMRRFEKDAQNFNTDVRVSVTLAALQNIARYMSGQRGRKVLLWFSAGFPISISGDEPDNMETAREYSDQIRRATNLLNEAHVAIYAIDAHSLLPGSMSDPSNSGLNDRGQLFLGIDANRAMAKETFARASTEDALERAAVDTGGKYFRDRNDIDQAINLSLQESGSYYMLGYYPSQKKWDGRFRKIKVSVDRPGIQVQYRQGYFAVDPENWRSQGHDKDLSAALAPGILPSTEVLFMARALPPARNAEVNVEFVVDPTTIVFQTAEENHRYCSLHFEVQAFTPEGKWVKGEGQTAEAPLLPQTFERVQKTGVPMHVPIKLPVGRYKLRLGVRDNLTGRFGTAELPIDVGADSLH
jgi:VWFA-related protein